MSDTFYTADGLPYTEQDQLPVIRPQFDTKPRITVRPVQQLSPQIVVPDQPSVDPSSVDTVNPTPQPQYNLVPVEGNPFEQPSKLKQLAEMFGLTGDPAKRLDIVKSIESGFTAPGDALSGQLDPNEALQRSMDTAGLAGTGGIGSPKPVGSLGTFGGGGLMARVGEAIEKAATKINGKMYETPTHLQAIEQAAKEHGMNVDDFVNSKDYSLDFDGFKTNTGRYVSRKEAYEIANKNDQLKDKNVDPYSTDATNIIYKKPEVAPPFFSAAARAIEAIPQAKMSAEQWLGTLSNKPGVKADELNSLGLKDFLDSRKGQSVSKEDLLRHVEDSKVEVGEVNKGYNKPSEQRLNEIADRRNRIKDMLASPELRSAPNQSETGFSANPTTLKEVAQARLANSWFRENTKGLSDQQIVDMYKRHPDKELEIRNTRKALHQEYLALNDEYNVTSANNGTKYQKYQLPGGENYKETLLTLPYTHRDNVAPSDKVSLKYIPEWNELVNKRRELQPLVDERKLTGDAWEKAKSDFENVNRKMDDLHDKMVDETIAKSNGRLGGTAYKSSHWDEPNVLVHYRTNDRNIDGLNSKHIEEIQSDWHQQGREKGYKDGRTLDIINNDIQNIDELIYKKYGPIQDIEKLSKLEPELMNKRNQLINEIKNAENGVPNAPFKKDWPDLALKHIIHTAIKEGKDAISWTPGEAQAARYDLSKQVDKIKYSPETQTLLGIKNGMNVINEIVPKDKLATYIGKEAAKNILENPTNKSMIGNSEYHELSGDGLKIGGEGMREFYDKMLVNKVNALGKKYGGKVEQGNLNPLKSSSISSGPIPKGEIVHIFKIPPQMKKDVASHGFPLFSSPAPVLVPVEHNPFVDDKNHV